MLAPRQIDNARLRGHVDGDCRRAEHAQDTILHTFDQVCGHVGNWPRANRERELLHDANQIDFD